MKQVQPERISTWNCVPPAIRFLRGNRNWWTLPVVWTDIINVMQNKPLLPKTSGYRRLYNAGRKWASCILYFPMWLARPSELAVGGQAVIEGVMMRGQKGFAIAVRRPDGVVAVKREQKVPLYKKFKALGIPIIRGVAVLFEALMIGFRALEYSANIAAQEEPVDDLDFDEDEDIPQIGKFAMFTMFLISMLVGIGLFVVMPNLVTQWANIDEATHPFLFHLIAGAIRIAIFLGYIIGISYMPDIKRVFEYHGAEHKTIHNYESDEELTIINAKRKSRLHPRCGTSFVLTVMVVTIFAFALVSGLVVTFWSGFHEYHTYVQKLILIPLHILTVLPIAGISYEINRRCAKNLESPISKIVTYPGLALQRITTREPDGQQLEVAIVALKRTLEFGEV